MMSEFTVHDLLLECPDDQVMRMQQAWRAVAAGDWAEAVFKLRNAAVEGTTEWHDRCAVLAVEYETRVVPTRETMNTQE